MGSVFMFRTPNNAPGSETAPKSNLTMAVSSRWACSLGTSCNGRCTPTAQLPLHTTGWITTGQHQNLAAHVVSEKADVC